MSATAFNVAAGSMTYWSLGQQTDPDILQNGFRQIGFPDVAPAQRSWLASLKTALAEMFAKPEELIRPLKNKKRDGYPLVQDIQVNGSAASAMVHVLEEARLRAESEPTVVLLVELTCAGHLIQAAALPWVNSPAPVPGCLPPRHPLDATTRSRNAEVFHVASGYCATVYVRRIATNRHAVSCFRGHVRQVAAVSQVSVSTR